MVKKKHSSKNKTKHKTTASTAKSKASGHRRITRNQSKNTSATPYKDLMEQFSVNDLPDLDECVLGALEFFQDKEIPEIIIPYKKPLVVGSGNAEATGKI